MEPALMSAGSFNVAGTVEQLLAEIPRGDDCGKRPWKNSCLLIYPHYFFRRNDQGNMVPRHNRAICNTVEKGEVTWVRCVDGTVAGLKGEGDKIVCEKDVDYAALEELGAIDAAEKDRLLEAEIKKVKAKFGE